MRIKHSVATFSNEPIQQHNVGQTSIKDEVNPMIYISYFERTEGHATKEVMDILMNAENNLRTEMQSVLFPYVPNERFRLYHAASERKKVRVYLSFILMN